MLDCAQARDVFHVLVISFGKRVSPGTVGDEIKLLRARRLSRSLDRGATRIGNWPGRQAIDDVCVVGRRLGYLALGERVAQRALAESQTVNDRRIRLKFHPLLEPICQHRRDARALLGLTGLFFNDRCEYDKLLRSLEGQIWIATIPDFPHQPLLGLTHALDHLSARETAMEVVAVRQKTAFPRNVLDIAG